MKTEPGSGGWGGGGVISELVDTVSFTCPKCGTRVDGELAVSVDTEVRQVYPVVELWPGGPLVDDLSALPHLVPGVNVLTTSACACAFDLAEWDMALTTYTDSRRGVLTVTEHLAAAGEEEG
jgi:hypothetical protein